MRILITGAAGLVGSHLARAYAGHDVTALRHADLDIANADAVGRAVRLLNPEVIFNCAVIGVDDCEREPERAEDVNVRGPAFLAAAAQATGAAMVHFSSNYVFDGKRTPGIPYTIEDDPLPINIYGITKLRGERAVTAACPRTLIVRTSWVFGSGKDSFLSTVAARLADGERVRAITDTFASTTFVDDLVTRVIELVERGHHGTFHIVNEGVCSYETFAREAARILGLSHEEAAQLIDTTTEESMNRPAPRPQWTPMRCVVTERLGLAPLRRWEEALKAYLRVARPSS